MSPSYNCRLKTLLLSKSTIQINWVTEKPQKILDYRCQRLLTFSMCQYRKSKWKTTLATTLYSISVQAFSSDKTAILPWSHKLVSKKLDYMTKFFLWSPSDAWVKFILTHIVVFSRYYSRVSFQHTGMELIDGLVTNMAGNAFVP